MLQSLIGNIGSLDSQSADQLVELIDRHPYCQAFQMLYAVALANIHSTKLNAQVQRAAIAMPDRLKLCQVVSKGEYEWISLLNEIEERKNSAKSSAANDDFMLIERYLDNIGEPSSDSLPYDISSAAIAASVGLMPTVGGMSSAGAAAVTGPGGRAATEKRCWRMLTVLASSFQLASSCSRASSPSSVSA